MQRRSLRSRWRLCRLTDAASPLRGLSALQAAGLVALRRPHTPCRGRRPRRPVGHCRFVQAFVKTGMDPVCHSEERSDAGISHYPAGSQESHRRNCNCLQEIATSAFGLLAMTNSGDLRHRMCCNHCRPARRSLPVKGTPPTAAQGAPLQRQLVPLF